MKNKIKALIKNQYFIVGTITLIALLIRLLNIYKPSGLWYDEMLTYIFSSKSFPLGIMNALWKEDFHMPLYYFYAHGWMKLFGTSDVILRLSSVIWGALTIPALYYLGKTYRSKALGYLLSIFGCLSPILIYYSQEFRFYSMLVFFITVSLIFFLKLLRNANKKFFIYFGVSNLIILYIYTMGILFVGGELLVLIFHFVFNKKNEIKKIIEFSIIFLIFSIPYFWLLFNYIQASNNTLINGFLLKPITITTPFKILNDFFSPFIMCIYGPDSGTYISYTKSLPKLILLIFMSLSTISFSIGFFSSLKKITTEALYLLMVLLFFLVPQIYLGLEKDILITTRYLLPIFPILLLICANGIIKMKSNILKELCIYIILTVYLFNLINYKKMPAFSVRQNGYKVPSIELNKLNLSKNDYIIFPDRTELLKKYLINGSLIDFSIPKILILDKTKQEAQKVFDKNFIKTTTQMNSDKKLMPYFLNTNPTNELKNFINNSINLIPKSNNLIFVEGKQNKSHLTLIPFILKNAKHDKTANEKYKDSLHYLFDLKTYHDIKTILDHSNSLKKERVITTKSKVFENEKWVITIYEKQ